MFNEGKYFGQLREAATGEAQTGSLQIVLTFNITHRSENGEYKPVTEDERRVFLSLHPNARNITQERLQGLGFNGDFENPRFTNVEDGVALRCKHDEYQGRQVERWDVAGSAPVKRASADKMSELGAWWNASAGTSTPPSAKAPPTAGPPPVKETPESTREKAWDRLAKAQDGKTQQELVGIWNTIIGRIDKSETDFTSEDWGEVEEHASVPF